MLRDSKMTVRAVIKTLLEYAATNANLAANRQGAISMNPQELEAFAMLTRFTSGAALGEEGFR